MYRKVVWSPVECEWLKKNKNKPISQLAIALAKSNTAVKNKLAEVVDGIIPTKKKKGRRTKIGKRPDCNNLFFRSGWEANLFRIFREDLTIERIEYEPTDFGFYPFGIKKGTVSYTPDFKLTYYDGSFIWVECKGQLKAQDKTKIRRFIKFYPEEAKYLQCVVGSSKTQAAKFFESVDIPVYAYYNDLNKEFKKTIKGWE